MLDSFLKYQVRSSLSFSILCTGSFDLITELRKGLNYFWHSTSLYEILGVWGNNVRIWAVSDDASSELEDYT